MEMIDMSGYVAEEKLAIAKQYLVPQAMKDSGLGSEQVTYTSIMEHCDTGSFQITTASSYVLLFSEFSCLLH
jgi:hypothetical protein